MRTIQVILVKNNSKVHHAFLADMHAEHMTHFDTLNIRCFHECDVCFTGLSQGVHASNISNGYVTLHNKSLAVYIGASNEGFNTMTMNTPVLSLQQITQNFLTNFVQKYADDLRRIDLMPFATSFRKVSERIVLLTHELFLSRNDFGAHVPAIRYIDLIYLPAAGMYQPHLPPPINYTPLGSLMLQNPLGCIPITAQPGHMCEICLNSESFQLYVMTTCGHVFHKNCLLTAQQTQTHSYPYQASGVVYQHTHTLNYNKCPSCRTVLF